MFPEIIAGITITGIFIGISNVFNPKPKYGNAYQEIGITEYHELPQLKWFDSDDE